MKTRLLIILLVFGSILLLLGCTNDVSQPVPSNSSSEEAEFANSTAESETFVEVDPPSVSPTEAGKASITGSVFSTTYNQPIVGIPVSLSEIIRDEFGDGIYIYDPANSPTTNSMLGGYFVFDNIEPGEYVLVVGSVEINTYKIISMADGLPQVFEAPVDQITDLSNIQVEGLDIYVVGVDSQDGYPAPEGYPDPNSDS